MNEEARGFELIDGGFLACCLFGSQVGGEPFALGDRLEVLAGGVLHRWNAGDNALEPRAQNVLIFPAPLLPESVVLWIEGFVDVAPA